MVPDAEMPADDAEVIRRAPQLLAWYPDDPRLRLASAYAALNKGDDTEAEVRRGLKDLDGVRVLIKPQVEAGLWLVLGEAFMQRGANGDAEAAFGTSSTFADMVALPFDQAKLHLAMNRLDDALREATRTTEIRPRASAAWSLLGDIRFARGELGDAVTAYARAADLEASVGAIRARGLARFYAGDGEGALADLRHAAEAEPANLYGALWLDIVAERRGLGSTLTDKTVQDGQPWPAPVVRMFIGTLAPGELGRATDAADPRAGKGQSCEADFYVAAWDLVHARRSEAEDGFRKSMAECPSSFVETWMARAEWSGRADAR